MVVEISHSRDDTLIDSSHEIVELQDHHHYHNFPVVMNYSNCRDTSTCLREVSEEIRQSVNTHNSILNVTSDSDDSSDAEDDNIGNLFDEDFPHAPREFDRHPPTQTSRTNQQRQLACCVPAAPSNVLTDWLDSSTYSLNNVTESFVDVICFSESCGDIIHEVNTPFFLHDQVNDDVVAMLGCLENPTADELQAWAILHKPPMTQIAKRKVCKRSIHSRAAAIRRVRQERVGVDPAGLVRVRSMNDSLLSRSFQQEDEVSFHSAFGVSLFGDEDLDQLIGKGMEAIAIEEDIGYDSDPEFLAVAKESIASNHGQFSSALQTPQSAQVPKSKLDDELLSEVVEHTLNYTWSLIYHTDQKSTPVEVWMERGNILNEGNVIVEPKLMWREVYQGDLGIRKLSESYQNPNSVRLLHACRVVATFEKATYPLAHVDRSFLLRIITGEEFLFEASSTHERDAIMTRWKVVIARLATLAVMEDMVTMAQEFFTSRI